MKYRVDPPSRRPRLMTVTDGGRTAIVMIGPVRGPEHVELIRRLRYYHVPTSAVAPSRIGVGFVAFYEGASRFSRRIGMIHEYAEVLHVSQVRRRDLPGLPWPGRRGEDTTYYRFDLGPVLMLSRAITNPDRLRIVFRFPDLERLRSARTLREIGGAQAGPDHPRIARKRSNPASSR